MKKLLIIFLCLPFIGIGQGWVKNFYDTSQDFAFVHNVISTSDSGYAVINYNGLIKTNSIGDTIWTNQNYDGTQYGIQTFDGGYILLGWYGLYKLDNLGILQWQNNSLFLEPYFIEQTIDSGYVYTGTGDGNLKADERLRVVRTKSNGDTLWVCQPYPMDPTSIYDFEGLGLDVHQTNDGNYILAGYRYILNSSLPYYDNAFLSKINNNGDTIWTKVFSFGDESKIYSVLENSNNNFVFAGISRDWFPGYTSCKDILLAETDQQGNIIWVKTYESNCSAKALSIEEGHNGGYILCGEKEINNGEDKIWVIRTDNFGDTLWTKSFGNPYGNGRSVKKTFDGGYIITGQGYQNSFNYSIILIKIDDNGNVVSNLNIPINLNRKLQKTVDILGKETKPKANAPFIEVYNDGTVEKKIIIE